MRRNQTMASRAFGAISIQELGSQDTWLAAVSKFIPSPFSPSDQCGNARCETKNGRSVFNRDSIWYSLVKSLPLFLRPSFSSQTTLDYAAWFYGELYFPKMSLLYTVLTVLLLPPLSDVALASADVDLFFALQLFAGIVAILWLSNTWSVNHSGQGGPFQMRSSLQDPGTFTRWSRCDKLWWQHGTLNGKVSTDKLCGITNWNHSMPHKMEGLAVIQICLIFEYWQPCGQTPDNIYPKQTVLFGDSL